MLHRILSLIFLLFPLQAELTPDQKASDFRSVADKVAKVYAPIEWKQKTLPADPMAIGPWLERVRQTPSDLAYFELLVEYIASLRDSHTYYSLPSTFRATLGFTVDLYDGKVLIDSVDRARLREVDFPAKTGDELLKIDGQPVAEWVRQTERLVGEGTRGTQRRSAVSFLTTRDQAFLPRAVELGESATVEVLMEGGVAAVFTIPWRKTGFPIQTLPAVPTIQGQAAAAGEVSVEWEQAKTRARRGEWRTRPKDWVLGMGQKQMPFEAGEGFQIRRGLLTADRFTSGIFTRGTRKIAYVRIPQFDFLTISSLLAFEFTELDEVTDGLILDVMRNPGGYACGAQELAARVTGDPFQVMQAQHRVMAGDVYAAWQHLTSARQYGTPDDVAEAEMTFNEYEATVREGRILTKPMPLCGARDTAEPFRTPAGDLGGYTKPVVLLMDEFSASAAELLGAMLQDNARALVVGKRTAGAGGAVFGVDYGVLSEGYGGATWALGIRPVEINTHGELPTGPYIENIGILPDIELDFMTADNLRSKGAVFREALLKITDEFIATRY